MTKLSFVLPVFLFLFSNVFGQTDSNAASAAKDTVKDSNAVRPGSGLLSKKDSPGMRKDSPATLSKDTAVRIRKTVKKPVADVGAANSGSSGSAVSGSLSGGLVSDSGKTGSNSATVPMTTPTVAKDSMNASHAIIAAAPWKGPDEFTLMKRTLAANPVFNFFGKPVAEKFELHRPNSKDTLFYLLLGILFYFALIRIFFEKYFNNLLTLFFRVSLRQAQIREQVLQTPLPSLLLNGLFIFTAGLYACNLLHSTPFGHSIGFWILYLDCMGALAIIYVVKFLVLKFCGWVFNISRATDIYIFIVFLVNKIVGIFLLPFLILITFSGPEMRDILITISLTMIFVLLCYRVFASYRPIRNEIKLTPFHFFLYLCAFEIAPLLLIYKVLLAYLEKPY